MMGGSGITTIASNINNTRGAPMPLAPACFTFSIIAVAFTAMYLSLASAHYLDGVHGNNFSLYPARFRLMAACILFLCG